MATASITPRDRLSFTLFLAASLHAGLILGVGFSSDGNLLESPSIEVTLALSNDVEAPEDADFLASTNQIGSGTEAEALETTTTERADFHDSEFARVLADRQQAQAAAHNDAFVTSLDAQESAPTEPQDAVEEVTDPAERPLDREALAREIASLEARIAQDRQALAKMPRIKRLNSVSTKSAAEAAYLNMWRNKCERIGRANYPAGGVEGNVLMLVAIRADGTLEEVRVLQSSGHDALDKAALRTVRQASPYQPFTVEMRKAYDKLEFTRTWQFTKGGTDIGR